MSIRFATAILVKNSSRAAAQAGECDAHIIPASTDMRDMPAKFGLRQERNNIVDRHRNLYRPGRGAAWQA